jgi:DNA-directed RNA polymerase
MGSDVDRDDAKDATMKALYNSKAEPIRIFGEGTPELSAFYTALHKELPGAMVGLSAINDTWNATALAHTFTLPDGHTAHKKVTDMRIARIEVDELDHVTFSYKFECNEPSDNYRSLAPDIVHSVDSYIVREMVRRANVIGFELAHIHDAFTFHPNYFNSVVQLYREILAEIADSNLLSDILSEISGKKITINKFSNDLSKDILKSSYALS